MARNKENSRGAGSGSTGGARSTASRAGRTSGRQDPETLSENLVKLDRDDLAKYLKNNIGIKDVGDDGGSLGRSRGTLYMGVRDWITAVGLSLGSAAIFILLIFPGALAFFVFWPIQEWVLDMNWLAWAGFYALFFLLTLAAYVWNHRRLRRENLESLIRQAYSVDYSKPSLPMYLPDTSVKNTRNTEGI